MFSAFQHNFCWLNFMHFSENHFWTACRPYQAWKLWPWPWQSHHSQAVADSMWMDCLNPLDDRNPNDRRELSPPSKASSWRKFGWFLSINSWSPEVSFCHDHCYQDVFKLKLYFSKYNVDQLWKKSMHFFSVWFALTSVMSGDSHFSPPQVNLSSPSQAQVIFKKSYPWWRPWYWSALAFRDNIKFRPEVKTVPAKTALAL